MHKKVLSIKNLGKYYGDYRVFTDISLHVAEGEVISIIGASGSGKTTLLRCINLLEHFQEGEIHLDEKLVGYEIINNKRRKIKESVVSRQRAMTGMVFQSFNLFPHMTAAANVALGLIKVRGQSKIKAHKVASEWLGRVGLSEKKDSYPSQLSGGQQQRVAIARAIAMNPKIMLFDEATSALDPELVGEVLSTIKKLVKEGTTMLMVTHEMQFAYEVSDRIMFMDKGKVEAIGTPKEIFIERKTPRLKEFLSSFNLLHLLRTSGN